MYGRRWLRDGMMRKRSGWVKGCKKREKKLEQRDNDGQERK